MKKKSSTKRRPPKLTRPKVPAKRPKVPAKRPQLAQRRVSSSSPDRRVVAPVADSANRAPPYLVAAVGASAGGLAALRALLHPIPGDADLAVLIVQHLAPHGESHLAELLGRSTALRVVQATHRMSIEPRHVYVIPPNHGMTVVDGTLVLSRRPDRVAPSVAIDELFFSVASQYGDKGVAVILSGGGDDGVAGIREIKAAGGISFAQSPEQADHQSMPRAAIGTGLVDAVLPVETIADELVRLSRDPFFKTPSQSPVREEGQPSSLRRLFLLLRRSSGIDFTQYKLPTLLRRIERRVAINRAETLDDYLGTLQQSPKELEALQEDLLIHVTSFFRDPQSYKEMTRTIFPAILAARTGDSAIRAWVPGCATGEEVYSLAMILHEALGDKAETIPIQIFGTDVSDRTIDKARAGVYPESIAKDVSPSRLRRFFSKVDGGYRVNKLLRDHCIFARQDLTRDPPFSRLDIVVCRNLLIYLDQSAQAKVLGVFHYGLKPAGYLVLGRSETIGTQGELFAVADKRFRFYSRKASPSRLDMRFRSSAIVAADDKKALVARPAITDSHGGDLQDEISRLLVNRYAPPGVVIDGEFRVVRSRGIISPYLALPVGEATLDLFKMVQPSLLSGLRSALQEARVRGRVVRRDRLHLRNEKDARLISIEVTPVGAPETRHALVVFEESRDGKAAAVESPPKTGRGGHSGNSKTKTAALEQLTASLEDELSATREHLQAIIHDLAAANEELQSANEEILSSNEEMQSTNEELDTAKEELQSTNEELSTLNDELETRNHEVTEVNSDLMNLLASVAIPIVIVSGDLRIRRFTPAAEKVLNLIAADVGRPIGHIKPNVICPDLEDLIREVIDTVAPRERQVEDLQGRAYALRIRPYKTLENKIDGAVVTLYDITSLRDKEQELRLAQAAGAAIMATVHEPVLLLSEDLKVRSANQAFCKTFVVNEREIEGKYIYDLERHAWDIPALRQVLEEILPQKKNFEDFVVDRGPSDGLPRRLLLSGRRIEAGGGNRGIIALLFREDPAEQT
jgi:two-component system CheB/CheR fusion protein